uniref:G protein-coupled receptor 119 n=1 Tax=Tetraodon nigroviridis TaxID=99883 RepID=H3C058_TETNG
PPVTAAPVDDEGEGEIRPREMGLILSVASGLIISTNLLVAAAMLKMLLKKRSQSWCFVLNLALADFLVGVAITGLAALRSAQAPPPEGKFRCLMRMALVMSLCTASMMSMFFISLDRYAAIKMPLRYSQLSGKATAAGALLLLWICSLLIGFLPVMVPPLQTAGYGGFCSFFAVIRRVSMVVFCMCFFPVFSVFVYIYLDILKTACGHHKQIGLIRRAGSRTTGGRSRGHPQPPRSRFWSHAKALRTVAVLVGCLLLLWCPFFVVGMVELLCSGCKLTNVLQDHLWLLGLSNSLINPLVYAFWQKELRAQLAAMFPC